VAGPLREVTWHVSLVSLPWESLAIMIFISLCAQTFPRCRRQTKLRGSRPGSPGMTRTHDRRFAEGDGSAVLSVF
jgi:hypothetical protein